MSHNNIITYPDTGTPQHNAVSGRWFIDFFEGEVFDKSDNKTTLTRSLKRIKQEFIRSVAIFSSNAVKVNVGQGDGSGQTWQTQNGWTILENVELKQLIVTLVEAQTPDESAFLVIGSTMPTMPFKPIQTRNSHTSDVDAVATADAYAAKFERYCPNYQYNTFSIIESGGVNGLTYKIEAKMHSSETYVELQGDTAVAASASDLVLIDGHYGWLRLSVKNTVGGNNAQVTAEWGGSG